MLGEPPALSAAPAHDDPAADRQRVPAMRLGDLGSEANATMHHRHEPLRIHELGLELDDQEAPTLRVPSEDVDDAALAVVGKSDFGEPYPAVGCR